MYAVIDTETTGLSPRLRHRVAEVAVVLIDNHGVVQDEWCSLVNPDRDLGPQHIHGISAADVRRAPQFADIAGQLVGMLRGRMLVGHNVSFDVMFLAAEFNRLGATFPVARDGGLCTMRLAATYLPGSGRSLQECCTAAGVRLSGWHSALSDARASAGLLAHYLSCCRPPAPWEPTVARCRDVAWPQMPASDSAAVMRRDATTGTPPEAAVSQFVADLVEFMPRVDATELADPYLAVIDQTLADRYLSADETGALAALAEFLGLADSDTTRLHHDYLFALARVAFADHHLSDAEAADLSLVAQLLQLPAGVVDAAVEAASVGARPLGANELPLRPGDLVVFTGDMGEPREVWMQLAADHGFVAHRTVTKRVKLVVAADTDSLSGKAKKARGYDIPIMSAQTFRDALNS